MAKDVDFVGAGLRQHFVDSLVDSGPDVVAGFNRVGRVVVDNGDVAGGIAVAGKPLGLRLELGTGAGSAVHEDDGSQAVEGARRRRA